MEAGASADGGVDAYAGADTADPSDPWGCLDQAPQPSDPKISVDLEFVAFDPYQTYHTASALYGGSGFTLIDYTPLPGTAVQGCSLRDLPCMSPMPKAVVTDDAGLAHLTVPGDAALFYLISRSDSFPEYYYPGRPPPGSSMATYPIGPDGYAGSVGFEALSKPPPNKDVDAGPGHLFVTVLDCADRLLGGVTVRLKDVEAGAMFYVANMLPDLSATQTDSEEATAVFLNVPEGPVTFDSTLGGRTMTLIVQIHSGATTYADVRPRVRLPR